MNRSRQIRIGDEVQWVSQGSEQWDQPRIVEEFYDDKHVKVHGSPTGFPREQLSVVEGAGRHKTKLIPGTTGSN